MPIVLRHQAAGIAPDQENPRTKYGMAMVLQQQRSDQEMRQRTQDQQYDMQRMGAMGAMREMREPSIGEDDAMLEQEIRSGLYDPDTVRALRQDQRAMRQIMRDTNIDGTQRAQALGNLQSRMRMSRSTGKVQPMMQQMGPAALQKKPRMTESEYFEDPVRMKDSRAVAMQQLTDAGIPTTEKNIYGQMHNNFLAMDEFLQNPGGFAAPQGQGQPAAQPPNAPAAAPAANPQASYTGGQPTFGASPVMAQGGMGAPVGQGAYQPTGSYSGGNPVFGASPVLAQQSQQAGQPSLAGVRKWTSNDGNFTTEGEFQGFAPSLTDDGSQVAMIKRSDNGKVVSVPLDRLSREDSMLLMTGGNRDTQYAVQNPQMSAGQAYFDPNNPVRQEMSAADQSIVNPQKETLGKPGGRYGLGMIDYGINPATGNRVTASIRPGGTMPEYDEPVGKPGTAMGGRKGSVTIMGGRKKPAPAATADVSPGGTPVNAGLNAAAPTSISRDDPRVKDALAVAQNPSSTYEQQKAAAQTLKAAGITKPEVKEILSAAPPAATTSGQTSQPSGEEVKNAYEAVRSGRSSVGETAKAKEILRLDGYTDKEIQDLGLGRAVRKPGPPKPTQSDVQGMLDYLETGNPSDAEREVIEGVLKDAGVQVGKTPRGKNPTMAELEGGGTTASPGSDWKKYSESTRRSGEAAPASPSLLDQLEQAELGTASDATQGQGKLRTWTNLGGKYAEAIEGSLVVESLAAASKQPPGQQVIAVKKKDGQVISVPISELSEEDMAYLEATFKVSQYLDRYDWTTGNTIKVGKGKASKYEKPTTEQKQYPSRSGPRSKSYRGEIPEEVLQKPPSSSRSVTGQIS